jgi:hypothetical protein
VKTRCPLEKPADKSKKRIESKIFNTVTAYPLPNLPVFRLPKKQ